MTVSQLGLIIKHIMYCILVWILAIVHCKGDETDKVHEWGYYNVPEKDAPESWGEYFPACFGKRQSPVHIYSHNVTFDPDLGDLKFEGYDTFPDNSTTPMHNNGHTVVFDVLESHTATVEGGGLPGRYRLAQFHLHWGSGNNNGSEHWVDNRHYAAEVHLVHYHTKYHNIKEASTDPIGLAVLGTIIEIKGENNRDFLDVVEHLPNVAYADGDPYYPKPFPLSQLLPGNVETYYRYNGSLTTPPCTESVIWTVFDETVTMSQYQIDQFRDSLHHVTESEHDSRDDYRLVDNHRLPQELHDRKVYVSKEQVTSSAATMTISLVTMLAAVLNV